MDVLFCTQIDYSFGEREHALSFARQIERAGYRPHFAVAHQRIGSHIRLAGYEPLLFDSPAALRDRIAEVDPAMVVGCELFNLAGVLVRCLVESGRPVATLDGTTLGLEINNDPFRGPEFRRQLVLPEHYVAFRPCPVNDVGPDTDRIFHFRLLPELVRAEKDERVYDLLGLDPRLRTVLLPIAPWALGGARYFGLDAYHDRLLDRVAAGLDASGERIQLVVVANVSPRPPVAKGHASVHVVGLLRYDLYDHLLRSCDAIVSDNIIQNSVSKAVVLGIPHLIVQNMPGASSPTPVGRGGLLEPEIPFRCNIFPVRQVFPPWREYARIVDVAEFVDPAGIRDALRAVLGRGFVDPERRARRLAYVARLASLRDPGDLLRSLLGAPAGRLPERVTLGYP